MTHKPSLKARLLKYLQNNPGYHAKGKLCDLARQHGNYIGETTGRRLRELAEEGLIEPNHPKNHTHYKARAVAPSMEQWFDELPTTS